MGRYLSLDMGAESGRLVIVDFSTVISTEVIYRFETPVIKDELGRRCWDFSKIVEEVISALREAAPRGPFESLAVDTWGLDFGLIDANSRLISNPVSHRDHRTDGFLAVAPRCKPGHTQEWDSQEAANYQQTLQCQAVCFTMAAWT